MKDSGVYYHLTKILDFPTKGDAEKFAKDCVGTDYLDLFLRLIGRLNFKRTLDQNALYWKWVSEVGKHTGQTQDEVHREAKLSIGCPILYRDNERFALFYRNVMAKHDRQERLAAMEFVEVSSVMTTKQMSEFMNEFETKWRSEGVPLTITEERK